ncbi:MAG: hypothetical protein HY815_08820, partial [Candidatus Riflebacteria bacterium]|nr:hypothetical protein [Candidatus Riflebacteria bacterium]
RVSIEPGTFDARVSFETGVPWVAALECRAGEGPFVPVAAERPAAVRHRITVGSLRPAQSCELRFVLPDGTRSGSYRFSTLPLRLTWGPEDYRVRSFTVAFATDKPARCAVEYWPEESPARLVQSPPEESPATDHRAVLGLASPGQAHRIRVSAVLEDGTRTVLGNRLCQSLAGRCGRLRQELAPLDTVSLSAELARLEDTGADPGRTGQFAGRTTARHQKALTELLTLLPVALSEPSVKVDDKMLLYRIATPFLHLDAACESLKVPFSTGVTRALPSGFRPAAGAPPGRPWRAVGTPPSTGAWLVDRDATPVELVARGAPRGAVPRKECQLEIAVTGSGTSGGAAVVVFIKKQIHRRCESSLELALNGRAPLVLRPDCGNAAGPRPSIFHTFDPRLLVEGTNRVRLGLIPVPGLAGEPGLVGLERVEIWLSETSY